MHNPTKLGSDPLARGKIGVKWQPTPVLLPGKSHGQRSLVGCSPWGRTRLSGFVFTFHFHALEKEMATHSSVLAWRIPGTGEPGGLLSMGSDRVGHNWSDSAAASEFGAGLWRRQNWEQTESEWDEQLSTFITADHQYQMPELNMKQNLNIWALERNHFSLYSIATDFRLWFFRCLFSKESTHA